MSNRPSKQGESNELIVLGDENNTNKESKGCIARVMNIPIALGKGAINALTPYIDKARQRIGRFVFGLPAHQPNKQKTPFEFLSRIIPQFCHENAFFKDIISYIFEARINDQRDEYNSALQHLRMQLIQSGLSEDDADSSIDILLSVFNKTTLNRLKDNYSIYQKGGKASCGEMIRLEMRQANDLIQKILQPIRDSGVPPILVPSFLWVARFLSETETKEGMQDIADMSKEQIKKLMETPLDENLHEAIEDPDHNYHAVVKAMKQYKENEAETTDKKNEDFVETDWKKSDFFRFITYRLAPLLIAFIAVSYTAKETYGPREHIEISRSNERIPFKLAPGGYLKVVHPEPPSAAFIDRLKEMHGNAWKKRRINPYTKQPTLLKEKNRSKTKKGDLRIVEVDFCTREDNKQYSKKHLMTAEMAKEMLKANDKFIKDARAAGKTGKKYACIHLSYSYRSIEKQWEVYQGTCKRWWFPGRPIMWRNEKRGSCYLRSPAARPGYSNHTTGEAVDFYNWQLKENKLLVDAIRAQRLRIAFIKNDAEHVEIGKTTKSTKNILDEL